MGAAPMPAPSVRSPPTPERVAVSFIHLYYRVAARMPNRLAELYGNSSELNHGDGLCARGSAIAKITDSLPIAGCLASVKYLSVQVTGTGAYVVAVLGSYTKENDEHRFSQTFILENQVDSHAEHFFCRNDIFALQNASNELGLSVAALSQPDSDSVTPPVSIAIVENPPPPAVVEPKPTPKPESPAAPLPVSPSEVSPAPAAENTDEASESRSVTDVSTHPVDESDMNGSASHAESQQDSATREPEVITATPPPVVSPKQSSEAMDPPSDSSEPNGKTAEESQSTPAAEPVASARKTWASVVGKGELSNVVASTPISEEVVQQPAVKDQVETIQPAKESGSKPNSTSVPPRHNGYQNGPRSSHHGHMNRGPQRAFGPSAVIQLSSVPQSYIQDLRSFDSKLRKEFSGYGYKLRNVDIKAQKGIVFVEYETSEGVKAAVAKWASGARREGPFAGINLQVSEKRTPYYSTRRPGSIRGGRGGQRPGRRLRSNASPIS